MKMAKIECYASIPNKDERRTVMAWVRAGNFESYSEKYNRIYATFNSDIDNPVESSKMWDIIGVFEQYSEHGIHIIGHQ